jgi:hypothetical protein
VALGRTVSSLLKGYTTTAATVITAMLKSVTKFTVQVGGGGVRVYREGARLLGGEWMLQCVGWGGPLAPSHMFPHMPHLLWYTSLSDPPAHTPTPVAHSLITSSCTSLHRAGPSPCFNPSLLPPPPPGWCGPHPGLLHAVGPALHLQGRGGAEGQPPGAGV